MDKQEKHESVIEAERAAIEKYGKEVFYMLGVQQRLQIIQDLLPTRPLYSKVQIRNILSRKMCDDS